jgi:tRNA (cmo5U34)-methyltransferase
VEELPQSVQTYGADRAQRYDSDAQLLMGDRHRHRTYLRDLLKCLPEEPDRFLELGCGTGFFTDVFFEVFPRIHGVAVDGSASMLEKAEERFRESGHSLSFRCEVLQNLDWSQLGEWPLIFSALVVHHLSDEEKRLLTADIFQALQPGGTFILFDSFRPEDQVADGIIETLSCLEIQRQVEAQRGDAPPLERIIARDREVKSAEGDSETSIEAQIHWLRESGFQSVTSVFQDARYAGIVALKPR